MNTWTLGPGIRLALAVGISVAALMLALASPARATTFTVQNTGDVPGTGSLRDAIVDANDENDNLGPDTIQFASGVTGEITLTGGKLVISSDITINGPGADTLSVSGNDASLVLHVMSGTVEINDLTITEGKNVIANGGGILNNGTLTLDESVVSESEAPFGNGGGIRNEGTLTLRESVVSGNSGISGAGIDNLGTLTVERSTIKDNINGSGDGAGIRTFGTMTMTESAVSGNEANNSSGGGVYSVSENIVDGNSPAVRTTITNSTISGNEAFINGGGVRNHTGLMIIKNSTITDNTIAADFGAGGVTDGFFSSNTRTEVSSSIIAGNNRPDGTDADVDLKDDEAANPFFLSNGHNLIGDGDTAAFTAAKRDRVIGNASPGLGLLANNGGPTMTHAVLPGSPALDKGKSGSLAADQRGEDRTSDFPCVANASGGNGADIGAFERQFTAPPGGITCVITGTSGKDILVGTPHRDIISGLGGNDVIKGLAGKDTLLGGPGKDKLIGGPGKDKLVGGPGKDKVRQ